MTDNLLIPLEGFSLPEDFPWRIRFIAVVDDQLRKLRATGHFLPPRFFGYYFREDIPVGVSGSWTVSLDAIPQLTRLPRLLDRITQGQFSIVSESREAAPEFMLVHDRHGGACWLWRFGYALRFVEASDPVEGDDRGFSDAENNPKLLGP